jgi:hydrogenase nickel incorporation protein HypA/HybF
MGLLYSPIVRNKQVHEASIALAIVDEVCERSAHKNIEKVTCVHVRVGALTSVVPDALTFAWDIAAEGTLAAGSRLEIERVPLAIACRTCDTERTIPLDGLQLPVCPVCAKSSTEIVRGTELLITAMEVLYETASR